MMIIFDNTGFERLTRRKKPERKRAAYKSVPRGDPAGRAAREGYFDMGVIEDLYREKDRLEKEAARDREAIQALERKLDVGNLRAKWLKNMAINAGSEEEFDEYADQLNIQKQRNLEIARSLNATRAMLPESDWKLDQCRHELKEAMKAEGRNAGTYSRAVGSWPL